MIPSWANSKISNLRAAFKVKYDRDSTLTDEQIYHVMWSVFHDENASRQDELRVEAMKEKEKGGRRKSRCATCSGAWRTAT
jgi:hypothetical protein